jgi:hypothetical protein
MQTTFKLLALTLPLALAAPAMAAAPVTATQMEELARRFDAQLLGDPSLDKSGTAEWGPVYRCDAWPAYAYGSYYWIHWDVSVAAYQALSLCQFAHGYQCYYNCYFAGYL